MGKNIRLFFVLLWLSVTLVAAPNYYKQLETYDQQVRGANNDEVLRVFHGLKGIYIQAIISGDDKLKEQTLERLIKSARILKLDASKYESELKLMQKEPTTPKHEEEKKTPLVPMAPPPAKEKEPNPSPQIATESKVALPSSYRGKNVLHSVKSDKDAIVLEFGSSVMNANIKVFGLNSPDSYKKIVDIPAVIVGTPPTLTPPPNLQNVRITQYSTDTVRIVLDAPKVFDAYVSVVENRVFLAFSKKPIVLSPSVTESAHHAPNTPSATPPPPVPMPVLTKNATKKVSSKTIVIDAGHGGKDAGAIGYKQRMEKHLVLDMALQLGKSLKQRGHKVFYTRDRDVFINLRDRTQVANDKNADLFISLHANAAPTEAKKLSMKGLETFFLSPDRSERSKNVAALENQSDMEEMDFYSKETFLNVFNREKIVLSNKVAIDVQSNMLKAVKKKYPVEDGGVREAPFWVLVGATMPSVLIELGYISNPEESDNMFNPQYQKLLVEGISDGIEQYFSNNP